LILKVVVSYTDLLTGLQKDKILKMKKFLVFINSC